MALQTIEISQVQIGGDKEYNIADTVARQRIEEVAQTISSSLTFKGTVSQASDITELTDYEVGWCYKASASFTIPNIGNLEDGDMLICIADYSSAYSAADWTVVQSNIDVFSGATSSAAGTKGMVPAPALGDTKKLLRSDGTWTNDYGASRSYLATISSSNWSSNSNSVSITGLKCGTAGTTPPIIYPISNIEEYSKITGATATAGTGITFTVPSGTTISNDISICVVDFG